MSKSRLLRQLALSLSKAAGQAGQSDEAGGSGRAMHTAALAACKLGQPGRSARNLLLQIHKTNSVLVQFRGELAALTRRSDEVPPKSSLYHVAEIVVKMKKCTFLESNFQLASCKFVDDLQMRTPADHGSR